MKRTSEHSWATWIQQYKTSLLISLLLGSLICYGLFTANILLSAVIFMWGFMLEVVLLGSSFLAFLFRRKFIALSLFLVFISVMIGAVIGTVTSRIADDRYEATVGKENIRRGNRIVAAVRAYEKDHGNFPDKLEQLVPTYLDEIPKTVQGDFISYGRNKSYPGCTLITAPDGTVKKNECSDGKWYFHMRFPSKRFHLCYEFSYDDTDQGFSEEPWGMCDIL